MQSILSHRYMKLQVNQRILPKIKLKQGVSQGCSLSTSVYAILLVP